MDTPRYTEIEHAITRAEREANIKEGERLLPAWFVPRMMMDHWYFGLLLTNGRVLAISHIEKVTRAADGSIWLDICSSDGGAFPRAKEKWRSLMLQDFDRASASVNVTHIVCAFELSDG